MERFFLFCFRSCLKGDKDKDYYDVLELDPNSKVTAEIARKQYKKLSLALHPDKLAQRGVEVTADHKHRFLRLKEASDVLSDPKRKRIYDEYGESGLKLLENPAEMNHLDLLKNFQKNHGDRTTLGLFILFIFLCLFLLPVLFSLKSDGTLGDNAPWVAIWSPAWFVDLILLIMAVMVLVSTEKPETNEDGDEIPTEKVSLFDKLLHFVSTVAFVLLQIFITMRMDDYIEWSWFVVFIPWFVYEFASMISLSQLAFFTQVSPPNHDNLAVNVEDGQDEDVFMQRINSETTYFEKVMEISRAQKSFLVNVLRFWQGLFLAAKLDDDVDWNWGLVFLPIWVFLFVQYIYVIIYRMWGSKKLDGLNPEDIMSARETDPSVLMQFQQGQELTAYSSLICVSQLVPLFMAIMLVCRLEESDYSTFLIILPVFIFLGCICCVVFCGLCCLSTIDMNSLEEELHKAQGGGADPEQGAYEPPEPPAGSAAGAGSASTVVVMAPPEEETYGTFGADGKESQSPLLEGTVTANAEQEQHVAALGSTKIDLDID